MHVFLPAFLIGILAILVGILALIFRARIAAANARGNRRLFGDAGERVAQASTPGQAALVGAIAVALGIALIILSIV